MRTIYSAEAGATSSGREGKITSEDKHLELDLSIPKEMGGGGGNGTNPEQLFAAGYSACFSSAVSLIARQQKMKPGDFTIKAHVSLGQSDDHKYALAVELVGQFPELTGRARAWSDARSSRSLPLLKRNAWQYRSQTFGFSQLNELNEARLSKVESVKNRHPTGSQHPTCCFDAGRKLARSAGQRRLQSSDKLRCARYSKICRCCGCQPRTCRAFSFDD